MKVVMFGNAPEINAGVRYRVLKFADMLRKDGHKCIVCLPSSSALYRRCWEKGSKLRKAAYVFLTFLRRLAQMRHVPGADVVFFRGPLMTHGYGPPLLEYLAVFLNRRIVFDIDDAIWEPPDGVNSPLLFLVDFNWTWKMCRICRHAVVGNRYLFEHVSARGIPSTIVPTCIDMEIHTQKQYVQRADAPIVLGWAGVHTNQEYLDIIIDVVRDLSKKHNIVLSVASDRPYERTDAPIINVKWELQHAIDYHRDADIGLMPLSESRCARGKCAFKALQYMGVGTPCVVSPVGMNCEVVEDGINGFLADSPEDWRDKLERLIVDASLRERMGRAARDTVLAKYSHQGNYPKFLESMRSAAGIQK
ncbi:MAG: glycosyltransferase family 4 protein [Candidatus Hydrogenedentes bacterium]|nr:glycosyltransferase family 4 protein [Candidatus Hydrogenedentota bacterium]